MAAPIIDPLPTDLVAVTITTVGSTVRIAACGEIDSSTAPELRKALDAAFDLPLTELTVDLDRVTFLDYAGLCVLASAHRIAEERNVHMRVLASNRAVIRPLQITGLWQLLAVEQVAPGAGSAA